MRHGSVNRSLEKSGDAGTFAHVAIMGKNAIDVVALQFVLGELPPRDDAHNLSCLPPMRGDAPVTYVYRYMFSAAHGKKNYRAIGVLHPDGSIGPMPGGREACEIHAANLMGDILLGFGAQVEGCGGPGEAVVSFLNGSRFMSFTKDSPTKLVEVMLSRDQWGVSASGAALTALEAELAGEDVALTYSWV